MKAIFSAIVSDAVRFISLVVAAGTMVPLYPMEKTETKSQEAALVVEESSAPKSGMTTRTIAVLGGGVGLVGLASLGALLYYKRSGEPMICRDPQYIAFCKSLSEEQHKEFDDYLCSISQPAELFNSEDLLSTKLRLSLKPASALNLLALTDPLSLTAENKIAYLTLQAKIGKEHILKNSDKTVRDGLSTVDKQCEGILRIPEVVAYAVSLVKGLKAVTAHGDKSIRVWNLANGTCSQLIPAAPEGIKKLQFSHSTKFFTAVTKSEFFIYITDSGSRFFDGAMKDGGEIYFKQDETECALVKRKGPMQRWSLQTGTSLPEISVPDDLMLTYGPPALVVPQDAYFLKTYLEKNDLVIQLWKNRDATKK